ncbi:glycoprotease [Campylobacter hyointestinalis]|uniref:Glycoprotease family protein n=1 Tax=Campylobacter hyointestinalis subsp. hyointestinalis TaxID=91352 RepID=A0A0S4RU98_CAMHY|nr:glycoprotease [Campylobacter hyointestinalis]MDL2346399.1 glycoprotease [Campylobacter hyointestinalis]MDL2348139.1 glycoprotease [Campylobacter hyointestinalis]MDL2349884.1 glycoprotease [Campylobacter hyointestinalis]MDM1025439.1 glycoprotease [Campylobacter hyointestinalis]MDM1027890.1 glycoprotease [Campylobacter hyointestinalis]
MGIYENDVLINTISSDDRVSEALISILSQIGSKFKIKSITYANTPGSFMGLKVSYVVLKTYCIAKDCDFYAVSGFELNNYGAIRANKNMSFVYENGSVNLKKVMPAPFSLPSNLSNLNRSCDTLPNYIIDAI